MCSVRIKLIIDFFLWNCCAASNSAFLEKVFKVTLKKEVDQPLTPALPTIKPVGSPHARCYKKKRKFMNPSQKRQRDKHPKRRALTPLQQADIRGGSRGRKQQRTKSRIKSAWSATTTLLTAMSVYDAIKTPLLKPIETANECLYFKGIPEGCMPYSPPKDTGMHGMCFGYFYLFDFCFIFFLYVHFEHHSACKFY